MAKSKAPVSSSTTATSTSTKSKSKSKAMKSTHKHIHKHTHTHEKQSHDTKKHSVTDHNKQPLLQAPIKTFTPSYNYKILWSRHMIVYHIVLHAVSEKCIRYEATGTHIHIDTMKWSKHYLLHERYPGNMIVDMDEKNENDNAVCEVEYHGKDAHLTCELKIKDWGLLKEKYQSVIAHKVERNALRESHMNAKKNKTSVAANNVSFYFGNKPATATDNAVTSTPVSTRTHHDNDNDEDDYDSSNNSSTADTVPDYENEAGIRYDVNGLQLAVPSKILALQNKRNDKKRNNTSVHMHPTASSPLKKRKQAKNHDEDDEEVHMNIINGCPSEEISEELERSVVDESNAEPMKELEADPESQPKAKKKKIFIEKSTALSLANSIASKLEAEAQASLEKEQGRDEYLQEKREQQQVKRNAKAKAKEMNAQRTSEAYNQLKRKSKQQRGGDSSASDKADATHRVQVSSTSKKQKKSVSFAV